MSEIDDLLAKEGAAAEEFEVPEQLPQHVRVSRPNLGRPTVVSVRLSAEEVSSRTPLSRRGCRSRP